jgi:hypothetical protein
MSIVFTAATRPYPRWFGPFSPSRGKYTSLRVRGGSLKAYFEEDNELADWDVQDSPGARSLVQTVAATWGGGRVLLLPTGHVIKPLQDEEEVGIREFIGRFSGSLIFERHDGGLFDLDDEADNLAPGDLWPGPKSIGLECIIKEGGILRCDWYHPADFGREEHREELLPASRNLYNMFRIARPGDATGRVHVLPNGTVTTTHQDPSGNWVTKFVIKLDQGSWDPWDHWIGG